mmetsp:Transcript_14637/g.58492  ORF Transcript_14637/g.58492 Transcript_14637/m.58492 type:complete len:214 (-) Transcript_14637:104-745(-)
MAFAPPAHTSTTPPPAAVVFRTSSAQTCCGARWAASSFASVADVAWRAVRSAVRAPEATSTTHTEPSSLDTTIDASAGGTNLTQSAFFLRLTALSAIDRCSLGADAAALQILTAPTVAAATARPSPESATLRTAARWPGVSRTPTRREDDDVDEDSGCCGSPSSSLRFRFPSTAPKTRAWVSIVLARVAIASRCGAKKANERGRSDAATVTAR